MRQLAAIEIIRASIGEPLSDRTLNALGDCIRASSKAVQRRAIDALAAFEAGGDIRVVELLKLAMAGEDRRARWGAAYALGQIGNDAFAVNASGALIEALADDDGDIRWAAALLLVRLGRDYPAEIRAQLLDLAENGNPNARKMALYCIRDRGFSGDDVIAIVARSMRDSSVHVRLAGLAVLARIEAEVDSAAHLVLECLESDPDPGVRRAAAATLGNRSGASDRAMEALRAAARNSEDGSMQRAARSALERLEKR
jgi:HEAT repeat protein